MGLLGGGDWAQMAADLAEVRGDNEVSVVIRRGETTLAAQSVRVARMGGRGREMEGERTQQAEGWVVVLGGTDLDIEPQDRFNANGLLYEVVAVRPNQRAGVMAEARVVE